MRIVFLHPDLGIGGAERLVVDAAVALQKHGHNVSFITNHHDRSHCFEETRNGTIKVEVVGDWIPRSLFGKFHAIFAYIRMLYAAFFIALRRSREEKIDLIFCDLISVGIPILKFAQSKILFYCHFPDQLLSTPGGYLKSLYRAPLNFLEEKTTGKADGILVNSKFTSRIFCETFKSLKIVPDVLYPSLVTTIFDATKLSNDNVQGIHENSILLLSINRYERKKNLELALKALKNLEEELTQDEWNRIQLAIIGGYDKQNVENIEYFDELQAVCNNLNLNDKVVFLKSPTDEMKVKLLKRCQVLLYTPSNEHFGIVPLEAMYCRKPVIAVNSGGPTETIGELKIINKWFFEIYLNFSISSSTNWLFIGSRSSRICKIRCENH